MVLEKHIPGQNGTSAHSALRNSIIAVPNKTPTHEVLLRHIDGIYRIHPIYEKLKIE